MSDFQEQTHVPVEDDTEVLLERIKRLEDALASVQDTHAMEERIYERVTKKIQSERDWNKNGSEAAKAPLRDSFFNPEKHKKPEAPNPFQDTTEKVLSATTGVSPNVIRHSWVIFDILTELRTILSMFFDIRYRMGWFSRWTVMILFVMIMISHWWVPFAGIDIIGPFIDKLVVLVLAFVMIKILIREAQRYREMK